MDKIRGAERLTASMRGWQKKADVCCPGGIAWIPYVHMNIIKHMYTLRYICIYMNTHIYIYVCMYI